MLPPENVSTLAATLLAINPDQLKGVVLRGPRELCERWLETYSALKPTAPFRRLPANIPEERLLGGLDFAATIARGHPVYERGLLAAAHGGTVVLPAATVQKSTWQHVSRVLDRGCVAVERDGFSEQHNTTFAAVAVETSEDEVCPASFADRMAFVVNLDTAVCTDAWTVAARELIPAARSRLPGVNCEDPELVALCQSADKLGIQSPVTVLLAVATARTCAAFHSRNTVSNDDIACAAVLVYASRATRVDDEPVQETKDASADSSRGEHTPPPDNPIEPEPPEVLRDRDGDQRTDTSPEPDSTNASVLTDMVVQAVRASLPAGLLAAAAAKSAGKTSTSGRAGENAATGNRGRQVGTTKGDPRGGARLDIVATLRAAVPWQRLRKSIRAAANDGAATHSGAAHSGATHSVTARSAIELRRDDFRIKKCITPGTTTTLFVVDASGSSALHRLAEVKGAIELMLAEGYARRDRVAVIAFRGARAELLLPPTHALARARRAVAGMPAGGGTPIATALDLTASVVRTLKRDAGQTVVVILSDGQANVGRDGRGGRAQAEADARDAAVHLRAVHDRIVWIDSSVRQQQQSRALSDAMGARYVALPMATAVGMSDVARMAVA